MDIKSIVRSVLPFGVQTTKEVKKQTKTDSTSDREGNGQHPGEDQKQQRRPMTDAEFDEAVKSLELLPGIKENGLMVKLKKRDGVSVVFIEDATGKVVRRIPEAELYLVLQNRQKKTGQILDKAM